MNQSRASDLLAAYLEILLSYSERWSKLESEEFQDIYEQFNPNQEMVAAKRTFIDNMKDKMKEDAKIELRPLMREEIKAEVKAEEQRKMVIALIQTLRFTDVEIANLIEVELATVLAIRKELENKN